MEVVRFSVVVSRHVSRGELRFGEFRERWSSSCVSGIPTKRKEVCRQSCRQSLSLEVVVVEKGFRRVVSKFCCKDFPTAAS